MSDQEKSVGKQVDEFVANFKAGKFKTFTMVAVDEEGKVHQLGGFAPWIQALSLHHTTLMVHTAATLEAYKQACLLAAEEERQKTSGSVGQAVRETALRTPPRPRLIVP